jgi:Sulfatase
MARGAMKQSLQRWVFLGPAIVLLNKSVTFYNVWPTLAVNWYGALSLELAVCLLILAAVGAYWHPSRNSLRCMAIVWVLMIIGRFADVTAPSLYGREINLYWDLRHLSGVAGMLAAAAPKRAVLEAAAAALVVLITLYAVVRWAVGRIGKSLEHSLDRRILGILTTLAILVWAAQKLELIPEGRRGFAPTVSSAYLRQARLLLEPLVFRRNLTVKGPQPIESDLAHIRGADVFLVFIESYGAVSYERADIAEGLSASRSRFQSDIQAAGFNVVSAYVDSPTFGGGSWLAHVSVLSGVEVRDEDMNVMVMGQKRDTFVTPFTRQGYRPVAIMPGLRQSWPEGAFYGFDEIYGAAQLDYQGPPFGWWIIPDQFALARLDALDAARTPSSPPFFVFFPTVSSHTPYQPDWPRMLTKDPYDAGDLEKALALDPALLDLGPSYIRALSYAYDSIAGYLKRHLGRDSVYILMGDHQPPAAVSGVGAAWHVPVHVLTTRSQVIAPLLGAGFNRGMRPEGAPLGPMNKLLPILLRAFGDQSSESLKE